MSNKFLILGTENCQLCKTSKETLNKYNIKYTYIDLKSVSMYGENWRQVFQDLSLKGQRNIPIIFRHDVSVSADTDTEFSFPLTPDKFVSWTLLGCYKELLRYLDQLIDDLDADY